jgi:hypothetical protein
VDRLESMVLKLRSTSFHGGSSSSAPSPLHQHSRASSAPSAFCSSPRTQLEGPRNTPHDAEVVSRLLLGSLDVGMHVSPGVNLRGMVQEVRRPLSFSSDEFGADSTLAE